MVDTDVSWDWDRSVVDFASLKQNVLRLEQRTGETNKADLLLSVMGQAEGRRRQASTAFVHAQRDDGWFPACFDRVPIAHESTRPLQQSLIVMRGQVARALLLKVRLPRRFGFLEAVLENRGTLVRFIESLQWKNPWGSGNIDMDLAFLLAYQWKVLGDTRAYDALEAWFDWHDTHADPATGFWDPDGTGNALRAMAGGMHQMGIYFMFGRDVKHPEQAIRTTLALQQPGGLFSPDTFSHNCLDIDAVFVLANLCNRYGLLEGPVRAALERVHEANLRCFDPRGGGWHRAGVDAEPDWWSTWCRVTIVRWCAAILGLSAFDGPWDYRPRHPFIAEDGGKHLPEWTDAAWGEAADWPTSETPAATRS